MTLGEIGREVSQSGTEIGSQVSAGGRMLRNIADLIDRGADQVEPSWPVRVDRGFRVAGPAGDFGMGDSVPAVFEQEGRSGVDDISSRAHDPSIGSLERHVSIV